MSAWTDERISQVCTLMGDGHSFLEVGGLIGCSRSKVAGLVFRLRKNQDPRLPAKRMKVGDPNQERKDHYARRMGELADFLANGKTIEQAAKATHISGTVAYRYFAKMRKGLGWQAV